MIGVGSYEVCGGRFGQGSQCEFIPRVAGVNPDPVIYANHAWCFIWLYRCHLVGGTVDFVFVFLAANLPACFLLVLWRSMPVGQPCSAGEIVPVQIDPCLV